MIFNEEWYKQPTNPVNRKKFEEEYLGKWDNSNDTVILETNSQKDGLYRREMTRKEAEEIIERNSKWGNQFNIIETTE